MTTAVQAKVRDAELGEKIEFWSRGRWYTALVTTVYPNNAGVVDLCAFHPISGALPYTTIPFWDSKASENARPNSWRWA